MLEAFEPQTQEALGKVCDEVAAAFMEGPARRRKGEDGEGVGRDVFIFSCFPNPGRHFAFAHPETVWKPPRALVRAYAEARGARSRRRDEHVVPR